MRKAFILVQYDGTVWGTDVVEMSVPKHITDTELIERVEDGISNYDSDVENTSQEIMEDVFEQVSSSLNGSWKYVPQAGRVRIEG